MGMSAIGLSDHIWTNKDLPAGEWYRGQDETGIATTREVLSGIKTGLKVYIGCEADTIAPGKFSITPEIKSKVDYVLLSCSHTHMKGIVRQPKGNSLREAAVNLLELFISGVKSGLATAIAHPFTPSGKKTGHDAVIASISDNEFFDAFSAAAAAGVAIELNAGTVPGIKDKNLSLETPVRIITMAKRAGCKFVFGSDAHSPSAQASIERIIPVIEKAGVKDSDIFPVTCLKI